MIDLQSQRAAAWLGLVGLAIGAVMFMVFAWPVIRADLGSG